MNPMEMLKSFMGKGGSPEKFLMNMIGSKNSNPMINNLMQMANNGNMKGVETFARNFFNERGKDFDKEFSEFMKNFKG